MDLNQVIQILTSRAWIIFSTLIFGVVVAVIVVESLPKRYTATSSLILDVGDRNPITGLVENTGRTYLRTQVKLIESLRVARLVVDRLNLTQSPYFRQLYDSSDHGTVDIKTWVANYLTGDVSAQSDGGSEILSISYSSNSPDIAARVANAFAEAYLQIDLDLKVDPARRNAMWFAAQLNRLRQNLNDAQADLTKYQQDVGVLSVSSGDQAESKKILDMEQGLSQARTLVSEAKSLVRQFEAFTDSGQNIDALPIFLTTPEINQLKEELGQIDASISHDFRACWGKSSTVQGDNITERIH